MSENPCKELENEYNKACEEYDRLESQLVSAAKVRRSEENKKIEILTGDRQTAEERRDKAEEKLEECKKEHGIKN